MWIVTLVRYWDMQYMQFVHWAFGNFPCSIFNCQCANNVLCMCVFVFVCICVRVICVYVCIGVLSKIWGAWTVYALRCAVQGDESGNIVHHHQVRPASPDFADQASLQALHHPHPHPHLLSYFLQIVIVSLLVCGDEFAIRNWSLKKATYI